MTPPADKPTPVPPRGPQRPVTADVTEAAGGGFAIMVDGQPLRTPLGTDIVVPTRTLAEAIAAELRGRGPGALKPDSVPLTRMAGTALDRIGRQRADIERQLLDHAETELVCHRADHPPDLVARQAAVWQPLLDWLAHRHDALLVVTTGIIAKPQSAAAIDALRAAIAGLDIWRLVGLSVAVAASGSLVIGLAMVDGRLDAAQGFDASELDATHQIEKWGEDREAAQRRAAIRAELELVERFLQLLR